MASLIGGILVLGGGLDLVQNFPSSDNLSQVNGRTTKEKVLKLAKITFEIVGRIAFSIGVIITGMVLRTASPSLAVGALVQKALSESAPYFISSIGAYFLKTIL